LGLLADGRARCSRDIAAGTRLGVSAVNEALRRCWALGYLLRTETPLVEHARVFRGRGGATRTVRRYHLYLSADNLSEVRVDGRRFVNYQLGRQAGKAQSKSKAILEFLRNNLERAYFSKEVCDALKESHVKIADIMTNVRRFERRGFVFVRGYRTHDRETPFVKGYVITFIDQSKSRDEAIAEAVERTNRALADCASTNPVLERVRIINDTVVASARLRDIVSVQFLQEKLACSEHELEAALTRAMQLYPAIQQTKLFETFRYFYHSSMNPDDLRAATILKQNYIRKVKGQDNRVGHNFEAASEWYVDHNMKAEFWTRTHRTEGTDSRRIMLRLLRPVGARGQNAEVDRVWQITPGPIAKPITYVLSCKWSLVRRRDIDDFFNVLRWSKEFGVDTPNGRQVIQGTIGIFAAGSFDPKGTVRINDNVVSLASYAERLNIQILKSADMNGKLREHGISATVQRVCKIAKDEEEVRQVLENLWSNPDRQEACLAEVESRNQSLYEFERKLATEH
jgi:hypothetical protein